MHDECIAVLAAGQRWYVKLPEATACSTLWVCEITDRTVLLNRCCPDHNDSDYRSVRYKLDDITFVEEVQ